MIAETLPAQIDIDISAAFAHEIKNPVALGLAHVSLARFSLDDVDTVNGHLHRVENALTDINELVQEMLLASYGDPPLFEIDISEMLAELAEAYQSAWPQISFSLDVKPILFYGQEQFLRIIFTNLLKNAVEASLPRPGCINIAAQPQAGGISIIITDNGNSNMCKPHGNGLGLAICHMLAARINVGVDISPGMNGGCAATVFLPL